MAGLQRSATTFRRSGSSGLVWNERFFSGDLNQIKKKEETAAAAAPEQFSELRHCKSVGSAVAAGAMGSSLRNGTSGGGRHGFVAGEVLPAADPPSPRAPPCVCCGVFGKPSSAAGAARRSKPRRR